MHILLSGESAEELLLNELRRGHPTGHHEVLRPALLCTDMALRAEEPPLLTFSRQALLNASAHQAPSISTWSDRLLESLEAVVVRDQPWLLQVDPHYGAHGAGRNRCSLIRDSLIQRLRRGRRDLIRGLEPSPRAFTPAHSLVQLLLCDPENGYLAVAPAPLPWVFRALVSPFPKGEVPSVSDKSAPSRAFAKLLEAELRLGRRISAHELCVDLGASPGSWTYVAVQRGARVTAVDRAPLRADLMRNRLVNFVRGDAFTFFPQKKVDWLLCDVIAAPARTIRLLLDWIGRGLARHFVVTVKFKGQSEYPLIDELKDALPPLCNDLFMTRLCANKNEVCVFGTARA